MSLLSIFTRFLAISGLILTPLLAFAAENDNNTDLKNLETAIQTGKVKQQQLKKTAAQIATERAELNQQIKIAAKQIQQSEAHLSSGEKKLIILSDEESQLKQQYNHRKNILSRLLSALLKLEKNPPPALLTKPDDASNALRSAIILGKIVTEVKGQTDIIAHNLKNLTEIRQELTAQQDELLSNTKELRKQRNYIAQLLDQKTALSTKTRDEIAAEQQKMASLGQKAKNIRDLFDRIEKQKQLELAISARLAAEKETKRLRDLETKRLALTLAQQEKDAAQVAQIQTSITLLKKPPLRTAHKLTAFTKLKNKLPYPAQGNLLRKFGQNDNQGRATKGITIATRAFAQITSPAAGTILYARNFGDYGNLVIIDVGQTYKILLTGLGQIAVTANQFIETGDPIGIMPQNAVSGAGNGTPILYVEFRKIDDPIDSGPWWETKLSQN
ncbi:MAG: peptidoglycan DD-metalloendopeptidase family protein [Rhizobiales bacterium]|nr:peptidoglycan DD-metalloendopeptidase family protein [Hyphomicrobiales bacterium]NRB14675.1 peptidoglycan DD-metalloendopeptidase family protein [Hyphomicrobiales bacterium]